MNWIHSLSNLEPYETCCGPIQKPSELRKFMVLKEEIGWGNWSGSKLTWYIGDKKYKPV